MLDIGRIAELFGLRLVRILVRISVERLEDLFVRFVSM